MIGFYAQFDNSSVHSAAAGYIIMYLHAIVIRSQTELSQTVINLFEFGERFHVR